MQTDTITIITHIGEDVRPSPLPSGSVVRKTLPMATGVLDYFPAALAEVAKLSRFGNDKHNPGQPLHHSRGKSSDHADCILRHLVDRGTPDPDMGGLSHSVAVAWRALALLQEELEAAGAPMARGAWYDDMPEMKVPHPVSECGPSCQTEKAYRSPSPYDPATFRR